MILGPIHLGQCISDKRDRYSVCVCMCVNECALRRLGDGVKSLSSEENKTDSNCEVCFVNLSHE